jgi:hypothetical protein
MSLIMVKFKLEVYLPAVYDDMPRLEAIEVLEKVIVQLKLGDIKDSENHVWEFTK